MFVVQKQISLRRENCALTMIYVLYVIHSKCTHKNQTNIDFRVCRYVQPNLCITSTNSINRKICLFFCFLFLSALMRPNERDVCFFLFDFIQTETVALCKVSKSNWEQSGRSKENKFVHTMQNNIAKMAKKTFIERALEQILADKDISRSHHLQLKKACESALGKYILICSSDFID